MKFKIAILVLATLCSSSLAAKPAFLAVHAGETWLFRLDHGRPVAARRVAPAATPQSGEIRISATRMMGTTLTLLNNSPNAYIYRATLIDKGGRAIVAKSCVLPADNRLAMESWPQTSLEVRISDFQPAQDARCS